MAWRKKLKKNVPIVQMSDEELQTIEERNEDLVKSQLPLGRVKKVIRMNPDVEMLNSEALQLMAKAAEMFIKELSNAANQNAGMEKRKTIQAKDIDKAIQKSWSFAFLEDALDGWPKLEPKKRKGPGNESVMETVEESGDVEDTVIEESEDVIEESVYHEEEEEEEELPETVPEEFDEEENEKEEENHQMKDKFAEQF
uniref:CBFD_NFYB_HMF domain-containing protein n=1 Tax=Caenorhabditis tropicalis TaxID=1561998 RepID=A0A1I7TCI1_9PELO